MGWIKDFLCGHSSQEDLVVPKKVKKAKEVKGIVLGTSQNQIKTVLQKWVDRHPEIIYRGVKKLPDGTVSMTIDIPLTRKRKAKKN